MMSFKMTRNDYREWKANQTRERRRRILQHVTRYNGKLSEKALINAVTQQMPRSAFDYRMILEEMIDDGSLTVAKDGSVSITSVIFAN
jgi:predicted transcriptional regulator